MCKVYCFQITGFQWTLLANFIVPTMCLFFLELALCCGLSSWSLFISNRSRQMADDWFCLRFPPVFLISFKKYFIIMHCYISVSKRRPARPSVLYMKNAFIWFPLILRFCRCCPVGSFESGLTGLSALGPSVKRLGWRSISPSISEAMVLDQ